MKSILKTDAAEVVAIADPSEQALSEAQAIVPGARPMENLSDIIDAGVDGIVIATPTALHAGQAIEALRSGVSVFCQKPLGRTADEVSAVVAAARDADVLLAVDFSYRFTEAMQRVREAIAAGELGRIFAIDVTFHNAYGPNKPWFYDVRQSGGGCVIDLGVHLVDLALWTLDFPDVESASAHLLARGARLKQPPDQVEDYAVATLELDGGAVVRLACSWHLPAGRDAVISARFYGTDGGIALRNVNGSFYDFVAERYRGTATEVLAQPPDAWFGRAAADWATRLAAGETFALSAHRFVDVARIVDRIYGR
jgi:predicted dehydrogenase